MSASHDPGVDDYVVQGPPGTGKTEYMRKQVERLCAKVSPRSIMIGSLTKTAATEIRSRVPDVPPENVGTIHSFAFRACGRPTLATGSDVVSLWNERNPDLAIEPTDMADPDDADDVVPRADDPGGFRPKSMYAGQALYEHVNLLRNRRVDKRAWPIRASAFHERWAEFCELYDVLDFTGFVERAVEEVEPDPSLRAVLIDEAQDLSTLEMEFVSKFRREGRIWIMAGDPDQALYDWRGADWSLFDTIEDRRRVVLKQSHRVPRAAWERAREIVLRIEERRDAEYMPRKHPDTGEVVDGEERVLPFDLGDKVHHLVGDVVERLGEDDEATCMIVAPCGFHLDGLIGELRSRGVPFHNPFRRRDGRWNPLGAKKGVPMRSRIAAFVAGDWGRREDAVAWLKPLKGVLTRGIKGRLDDPTWLPPTSPEGWRGLFVEECHAERALSRDLAWWRDHLTEERQRAARYPLRVLESFGLDGLTREPRCVVGTIHSVKGGQASHVYVAPDLSPSFMTLWNDRPDPIHRLFYVGVTRAQRSLNLLMPMNRGTRVDYWLP